jgi:beta-phosphoglucomutase-like phosphatase (HAD superfamily)
MTSSLLAAAVLWDLDGTLVDSEGYWGLAEAEMSARYPGEWTHQDGLGLTGLSLPVACAIMREKMQITDLTVEEMIENLTDGVLKHLRQDVIWRPGALELATKLHHAGVPQAIVTMSIRRMAEVVAEAAHEATGLPIFSLVVAGDDVTNGKPHPEAYLVAAEKLGFAPSECVAIEDSVNGLTAAEAAGTRALGVPNLVEVPAIPGRNLWPTLLGVEPLHLNELFN